MKDFILVQRGTFTYNMEEDAPLISCGGVVKLGYMNSPEFLSSAIIKAYRRIMWNYPIYGIFSTGIISLKGEELKVFCRANNAEVTINAIKDFVSSCGKWTLKAPSHMEYILWDIAKAPKTNFWWSIDNNNKPATNWMAFFATEEERFKRAIQNDYENWWMKMPSDKRKEEYQRSTLV